MVANPYRSVEAAPVLKILAAVAVMSPADASTLWLSWGESCLGGVWQRDWSLPRVVWLEEIPARSFLLDLRKGGQSQLNTSEGGSKTLHWCWSKHRWRIRRIDGSPLLGQRSVICSSEWSYLKSNRAYYCSFIYVCELVAPWEVVSAQFAVLVFFPVIWSPLWWNGFGAPPAEVFQISLFCWQCSDPLPVSTILTPAKRIPP